MHRALRAASVAKRGAYAFLCVLLLVAASCATQPSPPPPFEPEWRWEKAEASAQEFGIDRGQCQAQAMGVPGPTYFQIAGVFLGCMNGKGWQQVPK